MQQNSHGTHVYINLCFLDIMTRDLVSFGATLYITLSPCKECSKLIHQSGIKRVVYQLGYRDTSGVDFLEKAGVIVEQIEVLD